MKELSIPFGVLFATLIYQFFFLNKSQLKESFASYTNDILCNTVQTASLISPDSNILSTGYIRKQINKDDILYDVHANLPNSQGGDYINESIVYTASLISASVESVKLGSLVRHNDGFYKLSTILPKSSHNHKKVIITATLYADSKPTHTIKVLEGRFI